MIQVIPQRRAARVPSIFFSVDRKDKHHDQFTEDYSVSLQSRF